MHDPRQVLSAALVLVALTALALVLFNASGHARTPPR
jgi:hypothetical protein